MMHVVLESVGWQRIRFFYDKNGKPFTFPTALETLISINNQIKEHIFNPKDYERRTMDERLFQNAF